MENPSTTAALRSGEQQRAYSVGKKVVNRELLKSFVLILCLLVLAVTIATVLAKGVNDIPKLNGVSDVIVTKCRRLTSSGHFLGMYSTANRRTIQLSQSHRQKRKLATFVR
jgi:hypothetical protein